MEKEPAGTMPEQLGSLMQIEPFDRESGNLTVIIETPKGCRNKYKYDPAHGLFKLSSILTAGAVFPFDFGFIPSTQGEDGDPLDVLLLMDEPAFTGCLIEARLIGVIRADQTEKDGKTNENDRLIAVAAESQHHKEVRELAQLDPQLVEEIEHFFISYTQMQGKQFQPTGRYGPEEGLSLIREGIRQFQELGKGKGKAK